MRFAKKVKVHFQSYKKGVPDSGVKVIGTTDESGTFTHFKPDAEIFPDTEFKFEVLQKRLRELSFLNSGIKINLFDEVNDKKVEFKFDGGLLSYCQYLNGGKNVLHPEPIYFKAEKLSGV